MDRQQIDSLHEQASQQYLNGDYAAALTQWRQILQVDPADERAQEGVRLCELMVDADAPAVAAAGAGELDFDLSLDDPAASAAPSATDPGDPVRDIAATIDELQHDAETPLDERLGLARQQLERGDKAAAAELCNQILKMVPGHPAATEMLERCSIEVSAAGNDIDFELSALDSLAVETPPPEPAPEPPVESVGDQTRDARQGEGLDFGDLQQADTLALGADVPTDQPKRGIEGLMDALESEAELAPEQFETPLSELETEAAPADDLPAAEAAAAELARRVADLMEQARSHVNDGNNDEAAAVLGRVLILDETHAAAQQLLEQISGPDAKLLERAESCLIEGVQLFDQGRLDDARARFQEVLEAFPEHREALHYLEKIAAAEAGPDAEPDAASGESEDLLGGPVVGPAVEDHTPADMQPGTEAIPLGQPTIDGLPAAPGGPDTFGGHDLDFPAPAAAAPAPAAPRRKAGGLPRWLVPVVIVAAATGAGVYYVPGLLGDDGPSDVRDAAPSVPAAGRSPLDAEPPSSAGQPPPLTPERADTVLDALERGQAAFDEGRHADAIIAYNEALRLDPGNEDALIGLELAGEEYRAYQEVQKQVANAQRRFGQGDYSGALRIVYRLPDNVDRRMVNAYKVAGWYNLGVISLRAGRCDEAIEHFNEVLSIAPDDTAANDALALAEDFRGQPKRGDYYRAVEAMPFRTPGG